MSRDCTILYVDNDPDSCDMTSVLLERLVDGLKVECAGSAEDAMERLTVCDKYELVLLDYWLPGMDGPELCRWIRTNHPHLPILFYSAEALSARQKAALDAGAQHFLLKPNDLDRLPALIRELTTECLTEAA
jgi:two-component system response regulator HydG/two-component system response regulator AtoC